MKRLTFSYKHAEPFLKEHEMQALTPEVTLAHERLHNRTGLGKDYLGWVDLPKNYDRAEFNRVKEAACRIQGNSEVFVVIGIGGSYLGARAAIEMLSHRLQPSTCQRA